MVAAISPLAITNAVPETGQTEIRKQNGEVSAKEVERFQFQGRRFFNRRPVQLKFRFGSAVLSEIIWIEPKRFDLLLVQRVQEVIPFRHIPPFVEMEHWPNRNVLFVLLACFGASLRDLVPRIVKPIELKVRGNQ